MYNRLSYPMYKNNKQMKNDRIFKKKKLNYLSFYFNI